MLKSTEVDVWKWQQKQKSLDGLPCKSSGAGSCQRSLTGTTKKYQNLILRVWPIHFHLHMVPAEGKKIEKAHFRPLISTSKWQLMHIYFLTIFSHHVILITTKFTIKLCCLPDIVAVKKFCKLFCYMVSKLRCY